MSFDKRGFTLMELIMVLALIVIVAAAILPRFDRVLEDYKLKTDARQLAGVLRWARQKAIMTEENQLVMFRIYQCQYKFDGLTYTLSPGVSFIGTTTFGEVGNLPTCGFAPSGAPTPRAGTATLKNKYNEKMQIIVNVDSGRVRVEELK